MARTDARSGPQTRARIADAAIRLFLERGFDDVTVAEVARAAGVSTVTVFKHFPRKEDLFLDRADDAAELLRAAVRDRAPGVDVLTSLREATLRLADDSSPLSGLDERSVPFFRTLAASPALVARAREVAAGLQRGLAEELDADPTSAGGGELLAALVIAGYATVLVGTARRRLAGEAPVNVVDDHRARLDQLFTALHEGISQVGASPKAPTHG